MTAPKEDHLHRARGALLGLAVGDAIGTTVEFRPRGSFKPLTDMVGGGPFGLEPGQFTDDTSMALCLAASLIDEGFDLHDQMARYTRWANDGYMSSNGRCFDIGIATRGALQRFQRTGNPLAGSTDPQSAGNGCIMRLAPVLIRYMNQPEDAVRFSEEQAKTTHQAPECLAASRLFGELLVRALQGQSKEDVLSPHQLAGKLPTKLDGIGQGRYLRKDRDAIRGTGYVVDSLGFDQCVDHHDADFEAQLAAACTRGIDVYFESVGGAVFDAVLPLLNARARVPVCGLIANYNDTAAPAGPDRRGELIGTLLRKRIKMQGFIIFDDYAPRFNEFHTAMTTWLQ